MSSDIAINVSCDASELTSGMTETRDQLDQTITTIHRQESAWSAMAVSAVYSVTHIVGPIIGLIGAQKTLQAATIGLGAARAGTVAPTLSLAASQKLLAMSTTASTAATVVAIPPTFTLAAAVNFLLAPITLIVVGLALAAAAIWYFSSSADAGAASIKNASNASDDASSKMSGLGQVLEAVNVGLFGEKWFETMNGLGTASSDLMSAFGNLQGALTKPFVDAGFEVGGLLEVFTGLNSKVSMFTEGIKLTTSGIDSLTAQAKSGIAALTLFGFQLATGADTETAKKYLAERDAIQAMAIEADRFGKASRFAFDEVSSLLKDATADAEHRTEITRIGSLTTLEALDMEKDKLEALITTLKQKGKYDDDAQKMAAEKAKAIANQEEDVAGGKVKEKESPAIAAINAANQAYRELTLGKNEAALAALRDKGATDDEIEALRGSLKVNADIAAGREAERKATEEANAAIDKRISLQVEAAKSSAKLRDEIDVLTGAMTKEEAAKNALVRNGMTENQAKEIAALEAQKDKLSEAAKGQEKPAALKAAFKGSQEAASIMLRGIGGGKSIEQLAQQQLSVQQQQLIATRENKPQPMQPITLGVA